MRLAVRLLQLAVRHYDYPSAHPPGLGSYKISDLDMAADIFTKPVEKAKFVRMRDYIMNVHSTLRESLEDAMICAVGASHRMMTSLLRRL